MKRISFISLLVLVLCVIFPLTTEAGVTTAELIDKARENRIPREVMEQTGPVVLKDFAAVIEPAQKVFVMVAFFIMVWGLKNAFSEDNEEDRLRRLIGCTTAFAAIGLITPATKGMDKAFTAIAKEIAPTTAQTSAQIWEVAFSFQNMDIERVDKILVDKYAVEVKEGAQATAGSDSSDGSQTNGFSWGNPLDGLSRAFDGFTASVGQLMTKAFDKLTWLTPATIWVRLAFIFNKVINYFVASFLANIVWGCLACCTLIINVMEMLRFFLFHAMSILLPVFIALTTVKSFSSLGRTYIMQFIGVFAWPIGWALGNLGTLGMFAALLNIMIEPVLELDAISKGYNPELTWGLQNVTQSIMYGDPNSVFFKGLQAAGVQVEQLGLKVGAVEYAQVLYSIDFSMVMRITIGLLGMIMWIFTITLTTPLAINGLLASGTSVFHSAIGNTGQQTGQIITNAARMAVFRSFGGFSRGGGGGGSVATRNPGGR